MTNNCSLRAIIPPADYFWGYFDCEWEGIRYRTPFPECVDIFWIEIGNNYAPYARVPADQIEEVTLALYGSIVKGFRPLTGKKDFYILSEDATGYMSSWRKRSKWYYETLMENQWDNSSTSKLSSIPFFEISEDDPFRHGGSFKLALQERRLLPMCWDNRPTVFLLKDGEYD